MNRLRKSKQLSFWSALELIPGLSAVEYEWSSLIGTEFNSARAYLHPNGKLAESYPCIYPEGCGCYYDVVQHTQEDIVAVSHCEHGCDIIRLNRADIVVYELNLSALASELATTLNLINVADRSTGLSKTSLIGIYSPFAGFRFPVYLTIQYESSGFDSIALGLLSRDKAPFILLSPTHNLCKAKTAELIREKRSILIPLEEYVTLVDQGHLVPLNTIDNLFAQFRATNLPTQKTESLAFFPTPPDAVWNDVIMRFIDGYTLSIKVRSETGVFNYSQMNMANKRNAEPTVQWELLRTFADEHGVLDWNSKKADRRNQKRREILAADLRAFFRIDGDPFRLTDDGKGWEARFQILSDH